MRKKSMLIILVVISIYTFIILTSCTKKNNNSEDKIQIWYYVNFNFNESQVNIIVEKAKQYCENNNIPLEVYGYNKDTLSIDDYLFKRNMAMAKGNVIIIDKLRNLSMISEHHADYNNIDNYNDLLPAYKDRYFIPLNGVPYGAMPIENSVMEHYGIMPESRIMTYANYLELKQTMKAKGAKFTLSEGEYFQLIDYQMYKKDLLFLHEDSKILDDKNWLKEELKNVCIEICRDIILNYESSVKYNFSKIIYDENSSLLLSDDRLENKILHILNPRNYTLKQEMFTPTIEKDPKDKSYYTIPFEALDDFLNNIFIYKKVTNSKIYDLVNYLINEETYMMLNAYDPKNPPPKHSSFFSPIFKLDKLKNALNVNDNLEFVDDNWNEDIRELVTIAYDVLVKDEEKTKEFTNEKFANGDYYTQMRSFIGQLVQDIAQQLSGEDLSLKNFNPNDKEMNKMIDKKTNEFIMNFGIQHNK